MKNFTKLICFAALLLLSFENLAQNGSLKGNITDKNGKIMTSVFEQINILEMK